MVEKYLLYEKDSIENPFMQIKQKPNGELVFRFLQVTNEQFDFHYTRHKKEFHIRTYYKGMNPRQSKTNIEKREDVNLIKKLERIRAIIVTNTTANKKPSETIKKENPAIMTLNSSLYPKGLIDMIMYLNPSIPLSKVIRIMQPDQYVQDSDFYPPLLILCFKHSKDFLKLSPDMI
jgi:hypothetical protein